MARKKFYQYDGNGKLPSSFSLNGIGGICVFMNIPIYHLKRTDGCVTIGNSNADMLTKRDVGKQFRGEMLDPFDMGVITYLGNGFGTIPDGVFKNALHPYEEIIDDMWCVFQKKGKNACIIVVRDYKCKVTPVKRKK